MTNLLKYVSIAIVTIVIIISMVIIIEKKEDNKIQPPKSIDYNSLTNSQIDSIVKRFE